MFITNYTLSFLNQLEQIAMSLASKSLIIPGGDRLEDLSLVKYYQDKNYINRVILVGNANSIKSISKELGIVISPENVINAVALCCIMADRKR